MRASSASRSAAVARPRLTWSVDELLRMRLALVGRFLVAVDQHDVDAGERA